MLQRTLANGVRSMSERSQGSMRLRRVLQSVLFLLSALVLLALPSVGVATAPSLETDSCIASGGAGEVFFRTMSPAHAEELLAKGRLPATAETFISPTRGFAESYEGVLMEIEVHPGTTAQLAEVGVRDTSALTGASYPNMPLVGRGWPARKAFFRAEGAQINIGLGRGGALEIFNNNIAGVNVIRQ